jgi:hypothetical protein
MLLGTGCDGSDGTEPDPLREDLDALRTLTTPYQSLASAKAAGYTVKITDCMTDPQGGMGFHIGNGAYIDGTVDQNKPEVVMYEPDANGEMKLIGIEYVVPFTAWTSPTAPMLLGQSFARNEMFQVWALHVWLWRDNPAGTFASWNRNVSCAHAGAAKL